jgi:hypothetical protein
MALFGRSPFAGRFKRPHLSEEVRDDAAATVAQSAFFGVVATTLRPGGVASTAVAGGIGLTRGTPGGVNPGGVAASGSIGGVSLARGTPGQIQTGGAASAGTVGGAHISTLGGVILAGGVPATGMVGGARVGAVPLVTITPGGVAATGSVGGALISEPPPTILNVGGVAPTSEAGPFLITAPLGPRFTEDFQNTWQSGVQIGVDRPEMLVQIRTGRFYRRNARWMGIEPVGVRIYGTDNYRPWQPYWTAAEAYREVPNVRSVNFEQSLDQNGITSATVVIDNIFYKPEAAGYHSIKRGYMAPLRGYVGPGQTPVTDEQGQAVAKNEWYGLFSREAQILIKQGYGTANVKTFTGLIDDVDTTTHPDVITITARDFGKVLNDSRVFGWNKEPKVNDPIRFIDADQADDIDLVGKDANSSGDLDSQHGPENVIDEDGDSSWISNTHSVQAFTEYVEIKLPEGRYNDFRVSFGGAGGYEMYVSMNPKRLADGSEPVWAGEHLSEDQWIDGGGLGDEVPGGNGGHEYLRLIANTPTGTNHVYKLHRDGTDFKVGDDTLLRLSFRDLNLAGPQPSPTPFGAGVVAFQARRRTLKEEAKTQQWVRCDDASDVVRQVLRWAGFKEWEVDQSGTGLSKPLVVNRGMTYMDVIQKMKDLLGFTFFMGDPTDQKNSIGYPVFRKSLIITDAAPVLTVDDRSLLAAVDVKQSDEALAYIIRTRGRKSSNGKRVGGDAEKRIMYTYRPPWSFNLKTRVLDKLGGIIKHVIHTDDMYKTTDDVKFAAYYIALQEALASIQASIQINAHPGPQLDDHVALTDLGTGVTSRLSVQSRSTSFERSADGTRWVTTLGGALVDEPDVTAMVKIMESARRH